MNKAVKVYVKLNEKNIIIDINGEIFISDRANWTQIDEGIGDKYAHAQGNYLEKGLMDSNGKYNYKLVNNKVVELADSEKEILFPTSVAKEPSETKPIENELLKQQLLETQSILAQMQYNILLNK